MSGTSGASFKKASRKRRARKRSTELVQQSSPVSLVRSHSALHCVRVWHLELASQIPHRVGHVHRSCPQRIVAGFRLRAPVWPNCRHFCSVAHFALDCRNRLIVVDGRNHIHDPAAGARLVDLRPGISRWGSHGACVPDNDRNRCKAVQRTIRYSNWVCDHLRIQWSYTKFAVDRMALRFRPSRRWKRFVDRAGYFDDHLCHPHSLGEVILTKPWRESSESRCKLASAIVKGPGS
jgi:hypothetical protein